jgi:GNAT superfamily N-acetyltransferase
VELLSPSHDRASFDSGVPELDRYLHDQAGQDVRAAEFPDAVVRKLPRYPVLPATLLGRLAVNRAHRGQNLGRLLLIDALRRSLRNTSEVASIGVVVDALDESARAFYLHHEFGQLRDHPNRLLILMATIEKAFKTR